MSLENNLREGEKNLTNGQLRDPERYFLTIFGQPDNGRHLGLEFRGTSSLAQLRRPRRRSDQRNAQLLGANPATVHVFVPGGPSRGPRTLASEEQLAFDLVGELTDQQRARATIAAKAPAEYRAAGKPPAAAHGSRGIAGRRDERAGRRKRSARCWKPTPAIWPRSWPQRKWPTSTPTVSTGSILPGPARPKPGEGHYYRIQGPSFVLELVNIQADPAGNPANHIHSVWRSLEGDFGVAAN